MTVIEILSYNKGQSELMRSALVKTRLSCIQAPTWQWKQNMFNKDS